MQLVTLAGGGPDGFSGARLTSGEYLDLQRFAEPGSVESWIPRALRSVLDGGKEAMSVVAAMVDRAEHLDAQGRKAARDTGSILPQDTPVMAPVPNPRLLLASGLSYKSHLAEMSNTAQPPHPTGFLKAASSLSAPGALVSIPIQASSYVDYEGELACVIGRTCHNVSAEDAGQYIAGFTVANDLSARDWVADVWKATEPWDARLTWEVNLMGKQFPGFTALGPVLTTVDEMGPLDDVMLTTRVNGAVMQQSPIGDLIFSVGEIVSHFSKWYRFSPGDVLLTGTPAGVGIGRKPPVFMNAGDKVEVTIDRIGTLTTHFV